jgi:hypothetical protein
MKHPSALAALFLFLFLPPALAYSAATSYVELADAPSITVDWSKGNAQAVTLHGNRIFTFTNGQKGGKYLLIVKQDATGSRTVTWPSAVNCPGVTPPILTTTANKKDYISFFYDGVTYDLVAMTQNL